MRYIYSKSKILFELSKYKIECFSVGGRHRSATQNNYGEITSKRSKVLNGFCSICIRKKSMTFSDNTIIAEGSSDFFQTLGKKGLDR